MGITKNDLLGVTVALNSGHQIVGPVGLPTFIPILQEGQKKNSDLNVRNF